MLTVVASAFTGSGLAQEVAEIPLFTAPSGTAALGGGLRIEQNPYRAADNDDQRRVDLVPMYLFEGRFVFFRGASAGLHFVKTDVLEVSLLGKYRFQKLDPESNEFYEGVDERQQSFDGGLQIVYRQNWGKVKASWVTDTLDRHNGEELQVSYRHDFLAGPWMFSPFISWSWQDDDLTNYYFGVSEAEARADLPAYSPGNSQWVSFGLNSSWRISDRITLFGNVAFGGTDPEVVQSPLVEESGFSAAFIGGTYTFGNVRKPDYIISDERKGEWSWRVNYGYQADGNIVGEIDQGDFSRSGVADTNLAGITLGKLLTEGSTVDFVGKLAAFRHLEEDEGNGNFWSYAAFIMARGKGYGRWSRDEWFRWGFGFGMSYAQDIPVAEQRKQTGEGARGNTSHFLNYLEMTLDFPLRRVSKTGWLRHCYAGLSVVHRSGIFGTSDILGDVAGGSDWITAHLECTR